MLEQTCVSSPGQGLINRAATSLRLRSADLADVITRRRDRFTPPRRLQFVGDSGFRATGEEFLRLFREIGSLRRTDRVLDIGCGIGRMARVLVPELSPPGSYDGFDIVAEAVAWCREHYRNTPARFSFEHADLYTATTTQRAQCRHGTTASRIRRVCSISL